MDTVFLWKIYKCCLFGKTKFIKFINNRRITTIVRNNEGSTFGLLFDIDGVIARGKKVIPGVPEAFRKLVDNKRNFRVPTVFVTNAGFGQPIHKAKQLTEWLGIPISEDKVVMAHTPLKNYYEYHNKCVLVSGQGSVEETAKGIGFKNIVTIEQLSKAYPFLDAVDHIRVPMGSPNTGFPRIETILLISEPIRWETSLQLIIDLLMTNGKPTHPQELSYPHIPVLACNMDLQWMAEANMPRFGHGTFLLCLESLYKKFTGNDLVYSALVGKPSKVTYKYAHQLILLQAIQLGKLQIKHLYFIGDNVKSDILGANIYNEHLNSPLKKPKTDSIKINNSGMKVTDELNFSNTSTCFSVLVKTGVFANELINDKLDHLPRDFMDINKLFRQPTHIYESAVEAIEQIMKIEGFR